MEKTGMESIVICPCCREQVNLVLSSYKEEVSGFLKIFEGSMGIGNTEHFEGKNKCKCGKTVTATLHVTVGVDNGNS